MRIISPKFRDYYDGGLAYGQDASVTYVRETRVYTEQEPPEGLPGVEPPKHDNRCLGTKPDARWLAACELAACKGGLPSLERRRSDNPKVEDWYSRGGNWREGQVRKGCILFCGKQYPFYEAPRPKQRTFSTWDFVIEPVYSWDRDFDGLVRSRDLFNERHLGPYREVLEELTGRENVEANLVFQSPVVMWLGDQIIVNPCLTDYGFQRVLDPYTAFQEIAMFVGGVLGQNMDPPSPMTDKEKVKSHGFDPRYGFRTPPGGKKRKG